MEHIIDGHITSECRGNTPETEKDSCTSGWAAPEGTLAIPDRRRALAEPVQRYFPAETILYIDQPGYVPSRLRTNVTKWRQHRATVAQSQGLAATNRVISVVSFSRGVSLQ